MPACPEGDELGGVANLGLAFEVCPPREKSPVYQPGLSGTFLQYRARFHVPNFGRILMNRAIA